MIFGYTRAISYPSCLERDPPWGQSKNFVCLPQRSDPAGVRKEQVELLKRQAKVLQNQTGIYSGVILKGDALLAQYKLSAQQIQRMQPAMMELLAYQRQLGRSAEEIQGTYEAVGRAIMGQPRGLKAAGVELSDYQQRIIKLNAMMRNYAANARIIATEILKTHAGTTEAFRTSLGGQAAIAMARIKTGMEGIGEAIKPLIQLGQIISLTVRHSTHGTIPAAK
jgi:hypothetical protein